MHKLMNSTVVISFTKASLRVFVTDGTRDNDLNMATGRCMKKSLTNTILAHSRKRLGPWRAELGPPGSLNGFPCVKSASRVKCGTRVNKYPSHKIQGLVQMALGSRQAIQETMTTESAVLNMLLGAALVALGVLVTAFADRIRGQRASREVMPRERETMPRERAVMSSESAPRGKSAPTDSIPVVEYVARHRPSPAAPSKTSAPPTIKPHADGGEDVVAALVAAGYKKQMAAEATWACGVAERATVEDWTRAALRRCARGVS